MTTREAPLVIQVLRVYSKWTTEVLVYFTVIVLATSSALLLDLGLGVEPARVLLYTSALIVVLMFAVPAVYLSIRKSLPHRSTRDQRPASYTWVTEGEILSTPKTEAEVTEEKDLISKHHAADELMKVERQLLDAQREFLGKQRSAIQAITDQVPSQEAAQLVTELLAILQRAEEQYKDTRVIPGLAFGRRHDYGWTVVMATVLNHLSQMMLHSYGRSDWIPLSEQDMEQWLKDQKRLIKTLESPTHSESST